MWTVMGLLLRSPVPPRKFFLELLQTRPSILDKLLDCANLPLPEWYPESQVEGIACECLAAIFQFPTTSVAGLPFPFEGQLASKQDEAYETSLEILKFLKSRPGWRNKIMGIWSKIEQITYQDIFRYISGRLYSAGLTVLQVF